MPNEEEVVVPTDEVVEEEATEVDETIEEEPDDVVEDVPDESLDDQDYDTLMATAKKAIKDSKTLKAQKEHYKTKAQKLATKAVEEQPKKPLTNQDLSREEVVLIAKGIPGDEIEYLMALQSGYKAQGIEKSLIELNEKEPAVIALREKRLKEQKDKDAAIGPSGKKSTKTEPAIKQGMSREDHKKAWEKATGN